MNNILEKAIGALRCSIYSKTQLDILLHKQILLQVFRVADIRNWNTSVSVLDDDELAIAIFFHPAKLFNSDNFERFLNSKLFLISKKVDLGIDTYLIFIKTDFTDQEIVKIVSEVLHIVFLLSSTEELEFRVDTYS